MNIKEKTNFEEDTIFWIGDDIDEVNNKKNLEKSLGLEIKQFPSAKESFNYISSNSNKYNFKLLYAVINGDLLKEFCELYYNKAKDLHFILANIIISKNIYELIDKKYVNDLFFNPGGITDDIRNVIKYFKSIQNFKYLELKNSNYLYNNQFKKLSDENEGKYENIFSYINNAQDLVLPSIMNKLIKNSLINNKELYDFQKLLLFNYPDLSEYICPSQEKYIKIPHEILGKFFLYLYTCESKFYKDMNRILTNDSGKEIYKQFIYVLLYTLYKKTFKSFTKDELYRGSLMSKTEFNQIEKLLENKRENKGQEINEILYYSKTFLSFSQNKKVAEGFLNKNLGKNSNLVNYIFILKEIENQEYFINNILVEPNNTNFENESEVLFLPFSCFLVEDIKDKNISNLEVKYIYLKYLDSFKLKIDERIEEIKNSNDNKKIFVNAFMNDLGKEIYDLFGTNIIEEFDNYIEKKANIKIQAEKPNKNLDYGNLKVLIKFEPKNQVKYHDYMSGDELIYYVEEQNIDKEGYVNIIGKNFYNENKDKISLIINGKEDNLSYKYKLQKGINKIKITLKEEIKNLSYLFCECTSLIDIKALNKWNVSNVNNLTCLFYGCTSLKEISGLKKWDVKNVNYFDYLLYGCSSLENISGLKFWDVSNGNFFSCLFSGCSKLSDISPLKNWDVSNGIYFNYLFSGCSQLSDISPLKNWNVRNGNFFSYLFYRCESLSNISSLEKWDVSIGINFCYLFSDCYSLSDISPLKKWNVKNGNNFIQMFKNCPIIEDTKPFWFYKSI